ncbi:hypothetical protein JHK84_044597 [Glycine max]|uniref:Uncharacterized protein n=1 Tax=Glycine soja TaxID=3848 RepID=A0A0B2R8R1_GLYSO|nr:hypothetical protein JHK84_044597 [Glycine max]KHN28293.1 hypothetical protein glysoja_040173 [Glycine soja]
MGDGVWRSCPPDPNRFATSQSTLTSPILENVSHGQLQTRLSVPFDFVVTLLVAYLKAINGHGEAIGLSMAKRYTMPFIPDFIL